MSNPDWAGGGGTETCGTGGCYDSVSGPPVSSSMRGVFWGVGLGNPAIGVGADSGSFTGGFLPTDFWIKQVSASFDPGGLYHYPGFLSQKMGDNGGPGGPVTWSAGDVDGCGPNSSEGRCTCMMLTDEWNGTGYFATLSAASDVQGNTNIDPLQTIRLAAIPPPIVQSSTHDSVTGDVTLEVSVASLSGGLFPKNGGGTCLVGF